MNFKLHFWFKVSLQYLNLYNENKYWNFRSKPENSC
jgi:hypothetical protein